MCLDLNSDSEPTIDIDSWDLYRVSAHWWGGRVKLNQHLNQFTLLHILPCNICSIRFNTCCYAWVFALIAKYLLGLLYSPGSLLFICCVRESCRLHWFPSRFRLSIVNSIVDKMDMSVIHLLFLVISWAFSCYFDTIISSMASKVPLVPEYVYVVLRVTMSEEDISLISAMVVCHYEDTNNVFLIGGPGLHNETFP